MEDIIKLSPEEDHPKVATLVFMDLEATGLPSFVGKKNVHATEISLVAVNRNDFETDASFRILNKLSLCICPRSQVSPGAMSITGLYNDTLENQAEFDESIPKLLKYFFRRLKAPICLLAHNGIRYDFPLLQAELKRINYALGPEVLCVDTLVALRSIFNSSSINRKPNLDLVTNLNDEFPPKFNASSKIVITCSEKINKSPPKLNESQPKLIESPNQNSLKTEVISNDNDIDNLLSEDIELFNDIDLVTDLSSVVSNSNHSEACNFKSISFQNEHTPQGKCIEISNVNKPKPIKRINPDSLYSPNKQHKTNITPSSIHTDVKRKLFSNDNNLSGNNVIQTKPKSFSLPNLYNHFFGEDPPISHYAEADCIALSKICQKINEEFLPWIDKNSSPFNEIKELW